MVSLEEVLKQNQEYIDNPEPKLYPKLSVKLYGKGVVLDTPADGASLKMKRHQIARSGQVILSEIWGKKGAIGFVPPEGDGALCTSHFFLFDALSDRLEPAYLQAIFTANYLQDQLDSEAKGTTGYAAVRPKNLLTAQIPLPPREEQRRILARIEELAARIEEARGLRKEAMEDGEKVMTSTLDRVFNDEQWSYKKLTEDGIAFVVAGQHIMSEEYNSSGEGVPYLTGPADFGNRIPEIKHWTLTPKVFSLPGDVLLTVKGAGVGKINLAPDVKVTIGRQLMAIRPNSNYLLSDFVFFFLQHRFKYFQTIATATTVPGFKKTDVETLKIPFPPLEEQHRIVAYLDDLQARVDALKQLQAETQAELEALLPSVLDKAFRGELVEAS